MSKFRIQPHGRLQEWVAEEKGYFRDEGLDYEFQQGEAFVASQTWSAAFASRRSVRACFSESSGTMYSGANVLRFTPIFDFGRSRI